MTEIRIPGPGGYEIPCAHTLTGEEERVCVVAHGFGSSRHSPTGEMLSRELPRRGIGVIAFDFPAHGDSPVDGHALTVEHCIADLGAVEEYAHTLCPRARLLGFGSSYGAYISILSRCLRPTRVERLMLRSAAVDCMLPLFRSSVPDLDKRLEEEGAIPFDYHYQRPLLLTREFFRQLERYQVAKVWKGQGEGIAMVHGEADAVAPLAQAQAFARLSGAPLTVIPGGDHRLSISGAPERVLELTLAHFLP